MTSTPTASDAARRRDRFHAVLDPLMEQLQPLHLALQRATWNASLTGLAEHVERSASLDAQARTLLSAREPFAELIAIRDRGGLEDALDARQLDVLIRAMQPHQLDPEEIERMVRIEKRLDHTFNTFRARLDGEFKTDNQLREVLRRSDDSAERRAAWEASKQIGGEVAGELLDLVRRRNQAARSLGFENYYAMMLELDELDERELFDTFESLERGTRAAFETYKRELDQGLARRFGIASEALRPWHYVDPFFQEAPPVELDLDRHFEREPLEQPARRFFSAIGFEVDDLLARADLYEKPGKSQHAFCMSVDRGRDIRVLCNLRPNEQWMSTLLHELGHAVYDASIDPGLPWLVREHAHILVTEASAMLFGRLSKNAAWLEQHAQVPAAAARAASRAGARAVRRQLLVVTRWCLVMCTMERALYRDPEQDLDALWWELVERFQLVPGPEGRRAPDWASKVHFSVAPVYYHNYLLGEIMASQLQRRLLEEVGGSGEEAWRRYVTSPAVGAFLKSRLYAPGRSVDLRQALRQATGSPLDPAAFVAELSAAEG